MEAFSALLIALVGAIAWLSYHDTPSYFRGIGLLVRVGYPLLLIFFSFLIGTYVGEKMPEKVAPLVGAFTYVNIAFAAMFVAILIIDLVTRPGGRK